MQLAELEESKLIKLAQTGDECALSELDARYRSVLIAFACGLIGNHTDADDLAQSTLARAFQKLDQFRVGSNFRAWLFQIAKNANIDRKRKRSESLLRDWQPYVDFTPVVEAPAEEVGIFQYARRVLKPDQYEILWMKYVDQLSDQEIATRTNRSAGSVRVVLSRVRRRLQGFSRDRFERDNHE